MIHGADEAVLIIYLGTIVVAGWWLGRRTTDADDFMSAGRSLPGWAVGLSMFGSYVSSLSFLGNTGAAYASNWNFMAFTLAAPLAAPIAVYCFVPFYRRSHMISAYEHLEHRFGAWARTYAVACYLLTQTARMGAIVYLLGLAVAPLLGPEIRWDDVEEQRGDASVGEVRGDAASHDARAEDGGAADRFHRTLLA